MHDIVVLWVILKTEPSTRISRQVIYWGGDSRNRKGRDGDSGKAHEGCFIHQVATESTGDSMPLRTLGNL